MGHADPIGNLVYILGAELGDLRQAEHAAIIGNSSDLLKGRSTEAKENFSWDSPSTAFLGLRLRADRGVECVWSLAGRIADMG